MIMRTRSRRTRGDSLVQTLVPAARKRSLPVTVDPKIENFSHYRQVTCVTRTCRRRWAGAHLQRLNSEEDIERLGQQILSKLAVESVLVRAAKRA